MDYYLAYSKKYFKGPSMNPIRIYRAYIVCRHSSKLCRHRKKQKVSLSTESNRKDRHQWKNLQFSVKLHCGKTIMW